MSMSRIERAAFEEAQRLGHHWVGPEHGLLAILRGDPDDVARQALDEVGVDAGMVEDLLGRMTTGAGSERQGVTFNPAFYRTFGRAEGFAAGLGTGDVEPVHLLLAVLWDERRWEFAERRGFSREAVVAGLTRAGVRLPDAPLPELEAPIAVPPGGPPSTCQFCGGLIREGRRFVVPAKDRSWTLFFCSPPCASGFAVCAMVAGGHARGPELPSLAAEFGAEGSWHEALEA